MLEDQIINYLNKLMQELGETQESLAQRLGITKSSLQRYLKGINLPNLNVLIKIAELGETTVDDLIKSGIPKMHTAKYIELNNSNHNIITGGDAYVNTHVHPRKVYEPKPEDITGIQANRLKDLVNEVIELERQASKKPKTYGAVWNALNRKMGVTYYREIKQHQFNLAELYLMQWIGRNRKGLKRTNEDEWRKQTQSAIFAAARNQLGWTKDSLDSYIYERFKKDSIRDLTKKELQLLYNAVFAMKNKEK